ncbi:MAG: outer membrane protein assembly factor BamB, partial [Candidatus Latescibacterota bacterium]
MNLESWEFLFAQCSDRRWRLVRYGTYAPLFAFFLLFADIGSASSAFPYELQWKYLVPGALKSTVAHGDSLVFIGSVEGRVTAVRRRDGVHMWLRRDMGPVTRAPLLAGEMLVVADTWGQIRAFVAATGEQRWQFHRLGRGDCALAMADGLVYASAADGWLYALDLSNGLERWRTRLGLRGELAIGIGGGRIYASAGGRLVVLDAGSGLRLGEVELGALVVARPLADQQKIFVATGDGYVRAYRIEGRELLWSLRIGAKVQGELLIAGERLVCVADNGFMYGVDREDGALVWHVPLSGGALGGAVLGSRGEVFAGSQGGWVVAVKPRDGEELWRAQMGNGKGVHLAATMKGLWAAVDDNYVYSFAGLQRVSGGDSLLWDLWWEVFVRGEKTGYRRQIVRQGENGGWRIEEEEVDWRGGFRRSSSWLETDAEYHPIELSEKKMEGNQVVELRAQWQGHLLAVQRTLAGYELADTVVVEEGAVLPSVALLKLAREGRIRPGRRDSLRVVDLAAGNHRWLYVTFAEGGQAAKEHVAEARMTYDGTFSRDMEWVVWLDQAGRSVRAQQSIFHSEERRTDAQQARAWMAPIVERGLVLDRTIDDPGSVDWLVLQLPAVVGDPRQLLVEDDWQRVYRDSTGRWLLRIERRSHREKEPAELPIDDVAWQSYLASSLYIQADDPRVRDLALKLRGDERDVW